VPLDPILDDPGGTPRLGEAAARDADPDRMVRRSEAWAVVREGLERELTDRQRQALLARPQDIDALRGWLGEPPVSLPARRTRRKPLARPEQGRSAPHYGPGGSGSLT
jgi:hypothetical protein